MVKQNEAKLQDIQAQFQMNGHTYFLMKQGKVTQCGVDNALNKEELF